MEFQGTVGHGRKKCQGPVGPGRNELKGRIGIWILGKGELAMGEMSSKEKQATAQKHGNKATAGTSIQQIVGPWRMELRQQTLRENNDQFEFKQVVGCGGR